MRPTPDDYAEARRLLAPAVFGGTAADGLAADGHQHDHDEELGYYWFNDPPPRPNKRDAAYWTETVRGRR